MYCIVRPMVPENNVPCTYHCLYVLSTLAEDSIGCIVKAGSWPPLNINAMHKYLCSTSLNMAVPHKYQIGSMLGTCRLEYALTDALTQYRMTWRDCIIVCISITNTLPNLCLSCLLMHLVDTGKDVTGLYHKILYSWFILLSLKSAGLSKCIITHQGYWVIIEITSTRKETPPAKV